MYLYRLAVYLFILFIFTGIVKQDKAGCNEMRIKCRLKIQKNKIFIRIYGMVIALSINFLYLPYFCLDKYHMLCCKCIN